MATPDNGDAKGVQRVSADHIALLNAQLCVWCQANPSQLEVETIYALSWWRGCSHCVAAHNCPVLLYCDEPLAEKLCSLVIAIEEDAGGRRRKIFDTNEARGRLQTVEVLRSPPIQTYRYHRRVCDERYWRQMPQVVMTLFIGKSFSCKF